MKKYFLLFADVVLACQAQAQQIEGGNNVIISSPQYEDVYVAGGNITVNAPIEGDLVVAGGTVTLNDTVTQDVLLLAGGNVIFNGYVGDDIRCTGGSLHIAGNVGGDVVTGGGTVQIDEGVTIQGSLLAGGGEVTLDGNVEGMFKGAAGAFTLNGRIGKELDCRAGKMVLNGTVGGNAVLAAKTIEIGSGAGFQQDVRYWNEDESLDFKGTVNGEATYDPGLEMETGRWQYLGFASGLVLIWYLGAALIMIFIIQYLFGGALQKAAATARTAALKSIGSGFLYFIALPVIIVLTFITLVGVPVGLLLLLGYLVLMCLATIITATVGAHWVNNIYRDSRWKTGRLVFAAFGIFILLKLISLIPFTGFVIMLILACLAFGAILLNVKWKKD